MQSSAAASSSSNSSLSVAKLINSEASRLGGANAVLARELRVALRQERAFATLAIYVAVLGALVAAQFPADVAVSLNVGDISGSAQLGRELFQWFAVAQSALIALLLPALATGAVSQERERRTLEPLLLTPLTPLQIVWGKAAGVLAYAMLLLLATVPLTSLCFLLGGVSPGDIIGLYTCLLGGAACITALGVGCSAKWDNTTHATFMCYVLMPFAIITLIIGSFPGITISGFVVLAQLLKTVREWWIGPGKERLGRRLGLVWDVTLFPLLVVLFIGAIWVITAGWSYGIYWLVFGLPYFILASRWVMVWAAEEIARRPEPRRPVPERWNDLKTEWAQAIEPTPQVYMPTATGKYTYTPQTAPVTTKRNEGPATYSAKNFLPEGKNPVFMRDVRGHLLGKMQYLARYSYVLVIASELLLLLLVSSDATISANHEAFALLAGIHLLLLMTAGAVFGARSLAPEREQQTLPQLLTTPLRYHEIVLGKFMAVAVWTFYVWATAVPLALLLAALQVISFSSLFAFLGMEFAFGAFAMAWGLFCSMRAVTVRRAMGWSLGGIAALFMTNSVVTTFFLDTSYNSYLPRDNAAQSPWLTLMPTSALNSALTSLGHNDLVRSIIGNPWPWLSAVVFGVGALLLLVKTASDFKRYLREI